MKNKIIERDLQLLFKDKYNGTWQTEILKDIARIKEGEPLDFVIGWMPFLGCKIDLRFTPIIPRPETEYWTEQAIKEIKKRKNAKVLDLFAGSGAIGIAVLKHCKNARVDFSEYEPDLIKQIKFNLKANNFSKRGAKTFTSDVLKSVRGKYDFILANPPYIPLARKNKVHASVVKYERKSSLWGGKDGLFFINKFLKEAKKNLNHGGEIWMEFDTPEVKKIAEICSKYGYDFTPEKDQYRKIRYAVITSKV